MTEHDESGAATPSSAPEAANTPVAATAEAPDPAPPADVADVAVPEVAAAEVALSESGADSSLPESATEEVEVGELNLDALDDVDPSAMTEAHRRAVSDGSEAASEAGGAPGGVAAYDPPPGENPYKKGGTFILGPENAVPAPGPDDDTAREFPAAPLPVPTTSQGTQLLAATDAKKDGCPICAWPIESSGKTCTGCGWDLEADGPPKVERFRRRLIDTRVVLFIGTALVLAGAGYFANEIWKAGADERAARAARAYLADASLVEAERAFRESVDNDAANTDAWSGLARVYLLLGESTRAIAAAETALKLDATGIEAGGVLGAALVDTGGDLGRAATLLRTAIDAKLDIVGLHHRLARALHLRKEGPAAIAAYREALRREPNWKGGAESYLRLGVYLMKAAPDEAGTLLAEAEKRGAPLAEVRSAQGALAVQRKEYHAAVKAYEEAMALAQEDAWNHFNVASLKLRQLSDGDGALRSIQTARQLAPEQVEFARLEGEIFERLERPDDAYRAYLDVVARKPDDAKALRLLAGVEIERHELTKARDHLKASLAVEPDCAPAKVALAKVALAEKGLDEALSLLEQVINDLEDNPEVQYLLADVLLKKGDPALRARAITALQRAAQIEPMLEAPRDRLVAEFLTVERYEDAAKVLAELNSLRPDDQDVKTKLARIWVYYQKPPKVHEALSLLDKVLAVDPTNREAREIRAKAETLKFLRE